MRHGKSYIINVAITIIISILFFQAFIVTLSLAQPGDNLERCTRTRLQCTLRMPQQKSDEFTDESSLYISFESASAAKSDDEGGENKKLDAKMAEELALRWLVSHFGPPATDVTWTSKTRKRLNRRGYPVAGAWTVRVRENYMNIETTAESVVEIRNSRLTEARVESFTYKEIPETAGSVISREEAVDAWLRRLEKEEGRSIVDPARKRFVNAKLRFGSSKNVPWQGKQPIYVPLWVLDPDGEARFNVDAHTGKTWFDD